MRGIAAMKTAEQEGGYEQPPKEIERKFLIEKEPSNLEEFAGDKIYQGYLVIGADGSEARLRDKSGKYTLTVKSKGSLERSESEIALDSEQFLGLWPATEGKRLEKWRYTIPHGEHLIELDVYEGSLTGLIVAEVEFGTQVDAIAFEAPDWFGAEVTTDKAFKNQQLATMGRPGQY